MVKRRSLRACGRLVVEERKGEWGVRERGLFQGCRDGSGLLFAVPELELDQGLEEYAEEENGELVQSWSFTDMGVADLRLPRNLLVLNGIGLKIRFLSLGLGSPSWSKIEEMWS